MLHTKAQGHWPFGSGEEDSLRVFTIYGRGGHLVMWPRCLEQTFFPSTHGGSIWNLALIGPAVLEKKIFENGGRTDDRACLYYKLTNEPKDSGELINANFYFSHYKSMETLSCHSNESTWATTIKKHNLCRGQCHEHVCKVSASSPLRFLRRRFLNIFSKIYPLCCHGNQSNSAIWTKFIWMVEDYSRNISVKTNI